jgi:hypothetical protein
MSSLSGPSQVPKQTPSREPYTDRVVKSTPKPLKLPDHGVSQRPGFDSLTAGRMSGCGGTGALSGVQTGKRRDLVSQLPGAHSSPPHARISPDPQLHVQVPSVAILPIRAVSRPPTPSSLSRVMRVS